MLLIMNPSVHTEMHYEQCWLAAAVEDVESCTGSSDGRHMSPGSVPRKCRQAMDRLDACIEAHQQEDS